MFHVGQKVVCINDDFSHFQWKISYASFPRKDVVYSIRAVGEDLWLNLPNAIPTKDVTVWLNELINPPRFWNDVPIPYEYGFPGCMFKPLEEKKTDISTFTKILDNVKNNKVIEYVD